MSSEREKNLFVLGHIKNDLLPVPHMGGPATYISVAAKRLGLNPHLITKAPKSHKYLKYLQDQGINVNILPNMDKSFEGKITTGENKYDLHGLKHQTILERQEPITREDLDSTKFPNISLGDTVIIAPDIGEVDVGLILELRHKIGDVGFLLVSPQGYFRHIEQGGIVQKGPWSELEAVKYADVVILSDDDLSFDGEKYLNLIRKLCPISILTQGSDGLTVYTGNKENHISPFSLTESEKKDYDGAGDAATAAFFWHYDNFGGIKYSAAFAALYPALKIIGIGGAERGIQALPTLHQIIDYAIGNFVRVDKFYRSNGLKVPSFLKKGANIF